VRPQPCKGRPRGWAPSFVREALYRKLYRGEIIWNRTKKRDAWGLTDPSLRGYGCQRRSFRVVSEELWTAVHRRLAASREIYLRNNDGKVWGKPTNGSNQSTC
jgi:hypothetical protein